MSSDNQIDPTKAMGDPLIPRNDMRSHQQSQDPTPYSAAQFKKVQRDSSSDMWRPNSDHQSGGFSPRGQSHIGNQILGNLRAIDGSDPFNRSSDMR